MTMCLAQVLSRAGILEYSRSRLYLSQQTRNLSQGDAWVRSLRRHRQCSDRRSNLSRFAPTRFLASSRNRTRNLAARLAIRLASLGPECRSRRCSAYITSDRGWSRILGKGNAGYARHFVGHLRSCHGRRRNPLCLLRSLVALHLATTRTEEPRSDRVSRRGWLDKDQITFQQSMKPRMLSAMNSA